MLASAVGLRLPVPGNAGGRKPLDDLDVNLSTDIDGKKGLNQSGR